MALIVAPILEGPRAARVGPGFLIAKPVVFEAEFAVRLLFAMQYQVIGDGVEEAAAIKSDDQEASE